MKYDPPPAWIVEHCGVREAVRASSAAQACLRVCENRMFGDFRGGALSMNFGYEERKRTLQLCKELLRQRDLGESAEQLLQLEARLILSERQYQVAQLLAVGLSAGEAALRLGLATKTVEIHRDRIYRFLGIRGLVFLTHWALRHGVVANLYGQEYRSVVSLSEIDVSAVMQAWSKSVASPR